MTRSRRWMNGSWVGGLALAAFGLAGCTDYAVRTTLNPDGSGRRSEEMRVSSDPDTGRVPVSPTAYVYLMGVGESRGWTHATEVEDDDTTHVFRRERRVRDAGGWSGLDGAVQIRAATAANAETRIGHVVLGHVRFLNRVRVERGGSEVGRTFGYHETFYWENGPDPLVEHVALSFADAAVRAYPGLDAESRGELIGLARAGLWAAIDRGLLGPGEEDEDTLMEAFVARTSEEAAKTVRPSEPDAARSAFEAALRSRMESDDSLSAFTDRYVPGLDLAFNTSIEYRLVMPGRVTASNADHQEGDTLVWKFSPSDALARPVEVHAESVVEGE